jgi:hypothetical protein
LNRVTRIRSSRRHWNLLHGCTKLTNVYKFYEQSNCLRAAHPSPIPGRWHGAGHIRHRLHPCFLDRCLPRTSGEAISNPLQSTGPKAYTTSDPRAMRSLLVLLLAGPARAKLHAYFDICKPGISRSSWSPLPKTSVPRCTERWLHNRRSELRHRRSLPCSRNGQELSGICQKTKEDQGQFRLGVLHYPQIRTSLRVLRLFPPFLASHKTTILAIRLDG